MSTYDSTERNAYVALGALFGVAAGIGLGVLVAPRSGEETRRMLRERGVAAKHSAGSQIAKRREMAMGAFSRSLGRSKEMIDKAADKSKGGMDQTTYGMDEVMDEARSTRTRRVG